MVSRLQKTVLGAEADELDKPAVSCDVPDWAVAAVSSSVAAWP